MAEYFVRVELFSAKGDDYSDLHDGMAALGLNRTVRFDDGHEYRLPTGSYFGSSQLNSAQLRDRVRAVANPQSPHRNASVFVCQSSDWSAWLYVD